MSRAFGAIIVLGAVLSTAVTTLHALLDSPSCPTGFANFGDSLTDTGNLLDESPYESSQENSPYGDAFFGKPAKRFSNGRLVPDYFSLAFRVPLLDAYFSVASFNYKYGVNFATAGATAVDVDPLQTSRFLRFQKSVIATGAQSGCGNFASDLPLTNPFSTWLYTITVGANDIFSPLMYSFTPASVVNDTLVTPAVDTIATAISTLYRNSDARQFLIFGLFAGGCSPQVITLLRNQNYTTDRLGCLVEVNSVVQNFNAQLLQQIQILRTNLTSANIAYFDYYSANIEIVTNPATYGFNPALTTTCCCGAPGLGTLNYNPNITCGNLGSTSCTNPDQYLSWDGLHLTESFYRVIAKFALSGNFTDGGPNYKALCNLDFSKFGSGVTFSQAYPLQTCNNLFT